MGVPRQPRYKQDEGLPGHLQPGGSYHSCSPAPRWRTPRPRTWTRTCRRTRHYSCCSSCCPRCSSGHTAPVVHAAPVFHAAPVVKAAVEAYPDEVSPYTFNYAVADDYSASNFNAAESSDGAGSAQGSYNVNLPDGRTQHVSYSADPVNGFVAEVTYEGEAQYPETPEVRATPVVAAAPVVHATPIVHSTPVLRTAPVVHAAVHAAPVVHTAVHAAPVVHATTVVHARTAGQSSHQSVHKPFQGEARTTSQAKAFGSPIASVASSDSVSNTAHTGLAQHLGQGVVV